MKFRTKLVAGLAAVAISGLAAYAAGMFPGFPIVGAPSYCSSTNQAGVPGTTPQCTTTVPAGPPAITGNELIPADTQLTQGQAPQTVLIPSGALGQHGQGSMRNMLIGGDFATNPWQRGTSFATITPTVATMTADRWFAFSTGNTVTVNRQTGAADIVVAAGLNASMRVVRPSGTDVTDICVGQMLSQKDASRALGQTVVFSWYGLNGAGMSAVSGRVKASIAYGTATESATAGTNTATFALSTLTGYTSSVVGGAVGTTATVASGVATLSQSTTWTRYSVYATIPTTAINVGVKLCFTPVGTGGATDWIEIAGAQLETGVAAAPQAGSFARRPYAEELQLAQNYSFVLTDAAATIRFPGFCVEVTANTTGTCTVTFPTTMRITPTTTVSTATSFSMRTAADAANACTTLAAIATSNNPNSGGLSCAAAGTVAAGVASPFVGAATAGIVTFSAEP